MNRKRWLALGIATALFVISFLVNSIFELNSTLFDTLFTEEDKVIEEGDAMNRIAIVNVQGAIEDNGEEAGIFSTSSYNHGSLMDKLRLVEEDDTIKGLILRINTPGGGVMESAEIHEKLMDIKKNTEKPIYVSMGAQATSGGYYISTPADKIYASRETMTGSLGVIMQGYDFSGIAEKYGVKMVTIKSGPYKDILNPFREVSVEEKEILQTMINNSFDQFVKVIAEGRGMSEAEVRKIADGRIYDGKQAKENKLIDDFGYLDDCIAAMKKQENLKDSQVVELNSSTGIGSIFGSKAKKMLAGDTEMSTLINVLATKNSPRLMYLYSAE